MKKTLTVFILVLILVMGSVSVLAADMEVNVKDGQEQEAEVETEQEQEREEIEIDFDSGEDWGFKGNGGPMMAGLMFDFSSLNSALEQANDNAGTNFATFDDDYMILFGGGGLGGLTNGSRFGGYGVEGKLTSSNGAYKSRLKINYGGFLYERGVLSFKRTKTDVAIGALMGGGSSELNLVYKNLDGNFDELISEPRINRFEKDFVLLEPRVNLHQQLGAFVGLDISAGYLATYDFGETWKINDQVVDGPMSNFHCPSYTVRLSFGF